MLAIREIIHANRLIARQFRQEFTFSKVSFQLIKVVILR